MNNNSSDEVANMDFSKKNTYTVVTICMNSEKTIQKTIDSAMAQDSLPAEYIFVDGGSEDSTLDIIKEFEKKVQEEKLAVDVKLLHQTEKTKISGAWNIGIPKATSEVIFLLNSDDWYEPDTAKFVMDKFNENEKLDVICASTCFHKDDGSGTYIGHCKPLCFFPFMMPVMHPSCFVKKKVYDQIGYFDEEIVVSMDYDFIYRAFATGFKFLRIKKVTTNMLTGGNANSRREEARIETRDIALKFCTWKMPPHLAYFLRKILNR